ncbi:MAG TPA: metalloprotease PmbA, partial [Xanthomonadales bacterium]|nr:metalloprotease PmbA [Xanthomonadales bacterium]
EAAGREADARISTSDGATLATGQSLSIYANSHGFVGIEHSTEHSLGCGLIAGSGTGMQHDHWYSNALAPEDIEAPEAIGRRAAARAVGRLNPRPVRTGTYPVLFEAPAARSLIKHLLAAVSGGALYRRASFLLDSVDTQLFPERFSIIERPHLRRGFRSTAFDAEGVATRESALVENGVLRRYLLGSYSARRLGLETTGNAGGAHNLEVADTGAGFDDLLHAVGTGLLVTELMGQGV